MTDTLAKFTSMTIVMCDMSRQSLTRRVTAALGYFHLVVWGTAAVFYLGGSLVVGVAVVGYVVWAGIDPMEAHLTTDIWINSLLFDAVIVLALKIAFVLCAFMAASIAIIGLSDLSAEIKTQIKG